MISILIFLLISFVYIHSNIHIWRPFHASSQSFIPHYYLIFFIDQFSSKSTTKPNSYHLQRPRLIWHCMLRFSRIYPLYHVIQKCCLSLLQTTHHPDPTYSHKKVLVHRVLLGPYSIITPKAHSWQSTS